MKIVCEACRVEGYLQHISQNYYRVRHYVGSVDGKPKFDYHKQSLAYVRNMPCISRETKTIDPIDPNVDLKLNKNSSFLEIVAPPIGLEPMTDWLTASRSTGLSYGGSNSNCNSFQFYSAI